MPDGRDLARALGAHRRDDEKRAGPDGLFDGRDAARRGYARMWRWPRTAVLRAAVAVAGAHARLSFLPSPGKFSPWDVVRSRRVQTLFPCDVVRSRRAQTSSITYLYPISS